ncbi:MAG TPA: zf-HC2 domain-containing protein [Thermoanaerobaculia bacterium]|nr:zf-HC2 domain-containing protein [Thermoanaerobaculia bacterium]
MDHAYVEEQGLVALYRSGRLDPDEEQRFEEHFFACAACQEELDHQRRFERGLQAMQAEDAAAPSVPETPAARPEGKLLRFRLPSRPAVWLALAASLVLAPILTFSWLWQSRAGLEREAATWRGRAQLGEAERKALSVRLAQSERLAQESDEKARQLETQLAEAQAPPSGKAQLGPPLAPTADTPLLLLTHLRGTEPSASANRLDLRKAQGIVQLALDAGDAAGFGSYRATLTDAAGKKLFSGDALHPNALEVILLTFPRDFFAAGEYRLQLEGRRADGTFEEIEGYRFLVVR